MAPQRRRSSINVGKDNPLSALASAALAETKKNAAAPTSGGGGGGGAVTANSRPCSEADFKATLAALKEADDNETRLAVVRERCCAAGLLFSAAQILAFMETTPSVKTRLGVVALLAPRCKDPGASGAVVNSFRFTEDKATVTEAMKKREFLLKSGPKPGGGGGGGAGGGGGGGAGRGGSAGGGGLLSLHQFQERVRSCIQATGKS